MNFVSSIFLFHFMAPPQEMPYNLPFTKNLLILPLSLKKMEKIKSISIVQSIQFSDNRKLDKNHPGGCSIQNKTFLVLVAYNKCEIEF